MYLCIPKQRYRIIVMLHTIYTSHLRRLALVCTLMLLVGIRPSVARPITEDRACVMATKFYYMKVMGDDIAKVKSLEALDLVYTPLHGKVSHRITAPEYYIFAPANGKGFVIVAGDDRASQLIVGYSLEGKFSLPLSTSMQGYLNCYAGYVDALRKGSATSKPHRTSQPVAPLLTSTWGQGKPYNNYCPTLNERKLITGCVTTAVAQIMKYYEWPKHGVGECVAEVHNLDTTYTKVTLGNEYRWSKMKDTYSRTAKFNTDEVARLMRDVGHAVHVRYTPVLTSAYSGNVPKVLSEHFYYSPEVRQVHRSRYTDEEWHTLIAAELAARRPIYYSTRSTRFDGHAFVVCGIDEQGLYYVNWGWGGHCDGYFDFDAVAAHGTSYNYAQSAVVNIVPRNP